MKFLIGMNQVNTHILAYRTALSMAQVASNPTGIVRVVRPYYQNQHLQFIKTSYCSQVTQQNRTHQFQGVACQSNPDSSESPVTERPPDEPTNSSTQKSEPSADFGLPEYPTKDLNRRIALVSALGAFGLFLSGRLDFGVSLKDLSAAALPYEEALSNGKPTVVEFYADWCEVCRELAPDVYKVEQQFKNKVNFVMLNVDNTRWEQELDEFGVEGIPHFAFLDKEGNEEGNVVGRLPRKYLLENVDALARGEPSIPHARVVGQYTSAESRKVHQVVDPRSHG